MNLKYQFYQAYFKDLDLRKFQNEDHRKKVIKNNQDKLGAINGEILRPVEIQKPPYLEVIKNKWGEESVKSLPLETTYPGLIIGTGYPHETGNTGEFKIGFHFDHTSGLPVLPGHSVKGVLRSVFPSYAFNAKKANLTPEEGSEEQESRTQFIAGLLDLPWPKATNEQAKTRAIIHQLELALFENIDWKETKAGQEAKFLPKSDRMIFFDAHISGGPTDSSGKSLILGTDSITPHGENPLKNPIPLLFLKVLPGVTFTFAFRIPKIQLAEKVFDAAAIQGLFSSILTKLGIGAKTNVGYGQLIDPNAPPPPLPDFSKLKASNTRTSSKQKQADKTESNKSNTSKKTARAKPLNRWDPRDTDLTGIVVSIKGNTIFFETDLIEGFNGKLVFQPNPRLLSRFKAGQKIPLKLSSREVDVQGNLPVQVTAYPPES